MIENHMVLPDPMPTNRQPDEDEQYEIARAQEIDAQRDRDEALANRLGRMIVHISDRNSFDKEELLAALKEARERIDPTPAFLRNQAS